MESIKILSAKAIVVLLLLFASSTFSEANGQVYEPTSYIDSMAALISEYEIGSQERKKLKSDLRIRLGQSLKEEGLSKAQRAKVWAAIRDMPDDRGIFSPPSTKIVEPTVVSEELLELERSLKRYNDSISLIQEKLVQVVESSGYPNLDKEKATKVLASIHKQEVLQYLMENELQLRFGYLDIENDETFETYRTALKAIGKEYAPIKYKAVRDWSLVPILMYEMNGKSLSGVDLFQNWLLIPGNDLKSPWLLLEFMYENASSESKSLIKFMMENPNFKNPRE